MRVIVYLMDAERQAETCVFLDSRQDGGETAYAGTFVGSRSDAVDVPPHARFCDVVADLIAGAAAATPPTAAASGASCRVVTR